ncbi:MAG: DUF1667 domain-containing protein [Spirochaetes bacterium]|nr:DUF1667 domain-containing protein [Spirochaetota bacterium]
MNDQELICIVCPMGCRLNVELKDNDIENIQIEGNQCKRGIAYAKKELTFPTRMLPTTVKLQNGFLNRLPVRTKEVIPKELIFKCMQAINQVEVKAPVKIGDVILKNICNTGIDLIATRSMEEKSS